MSVAPHILDYRGQPVTMKSPPQGRAGAVPIARRQNWLSETFTTPAMLKSAWAAARRGDVRMLMRVAEEIENDPRLLGPLRTRRLVLANLNWRVEPGDKNDARAKTIAQEMQAMLQGLDYSTAFVHLQDAVFKPFAILELVWENGEETRVVDLLPRQGTEFTFDYENSGEQVRLLTDPANPKGEPINPLQFVVRLAAEKTKTNIAEGGIVRGLAARWLMAQHVMINWLAFGERDGMPLRVGRYDPSTATDEMISDMKAALRELGSDASALITKDMEIQIVEGAKNSGRDVFSGLVDELYRACTIGILGQVLTTQGNDQGVGTQALGTVHDEVKDDLRDADMAAVERCFTGQIIKPCVIFNYGEQGSYPQFKFQLDVKEDLESRSRVDESLQRMGFPLTVEYLSRVYDRPLPGDDETVVEPKQMQPVNPFGIAAKVPLESPRKRREIENPFVRPRGGGG